MVLKVPILTQKLGEGREGSLHKFVEDDPLLIPAVVAREEWAVETIEASCLLGEYCPGETLQMSLLQISPLGLATFEMN